MAGPIVRRTERQRDRERLASGVGVGHDPPHRRRRAAVTRLHGCVEAPHAPEAAREGDLRHRERRVGDELPREREPPRRGQRERAHAELGLHRAAQVAPRNPELAGQPVDRAVWRERALLDAAHRRRDGPRERVDPAPRPARARAGNGSTSGTPPPRPGPRCERTGIVPCPACARGRRAGNRCPSSSRRRRTARRSGRPGRRAPGSRHLDRAATRFVGCPRRPGRAGRFRTCRRLRRVGGVCVWTCVARGACYGSVKTVDMNAIVLHSRTSCAPSYASVETSSWTSMSSSSWS